MINEIFGWTDPTRYGCEFPKCRAKEIREAVPRKHYHHKPQTLLSHNQCSKLQQLPSSPKYSVTPPFLFIRFFVSLLASPVSLSTITTRMTMMMTTQHNLGYSIEIKATVIYFNAIRGKGDQRLGSKKLILNNIPSILKHQLSSKTPVIEHRLQLSVDLAQSLLLLPSHQNFPPHLPL